MARSGWTERVATQELGMITVEQSEEQSLTALLTASRNRDADSVASIWRELAPVEQENLLFALLGMQCDVTSESAAVVSDEESEPPDLRTAETEALPVVEQTERIPNLVDDLRGLTATANDQLNDPQDERAAPAEMTEYRSRWRQRWKWSVLVAAWAVTTFFAFTAETSTFGPMGWVVALFGTVVLGGLFVGTLANFVVAAIPAQAQGHGR